MAKIIGIMGESGAGKTTSLCKLPPTETFYIDADKKGLPWRGWREQYSREAKNYLKTDDPNLILAAIQKIANGGLPYHYIVIDTINAIMIGDEGRRRKDKNYDKWSDLAWAIVDIIDHSNELNEDITVIMIAHSETIMDDNGYMFTRIKTSGKKLSKIVVESKMNTVLLAKHDAAGYKLYPHAPNSTAKCPIGAIEEECIDNDIMLVLEALKDY